MVTTVVLSHCLNDRQMMIAVNGWERIFIGGIVPVLIVFGISGNILNLTVLLAPNMRTRSNLLLASLAVADIVCLIFMLPHSLAHYRIFYFSDWFRRLYLGYKMHLIAVLNWASAAAIWSVDRVRIIHLNRLVFVICLERLMGIKYPLSVRKHKKILTPTTVVAFVVVTTGIMTSYNHFSYTCATRYFCNGTQFHAMCKRSDDPVWFRNQTNPHSPIVKSIAHWAPHVNAVFVVVLPILMVLISNAMLIYTLRQRLFWNSQRNKGLLRQKLFMMQQTSIKSDSQFNGGQSRTEHKVTITVCAIVTCFTITQGPSALITIAAEYIPNSEKQEWMIAVMAVVTTLVVTGKALNFVLFCLSSATFRSRLLLQTKKGLLRQTTRHSSLPTTSTVIEMIGSREPRIALRKTRANSECEERIPLKTIQQQKGVKRGMSML